ncbi:unnamed protein product [Pleuronectes platessa]|uniref:Uncharacterized protein n=1 Tax=Pleuronectes platessa TaxID=8262 RepID=A0A9N7U748_PLEPL|nr:unnamed protein product [Pleuronectes platessa]
MFQAERDEGGEEEEPLPRCPERDPDLLSQDEGHVRAAEPSDSFLTELTSPFVTSVLRGRSLTQLNDVFTCRRVVALAPGGLLVQRIVYVHSGDHSPSGAISSVQRDTATVCECSPTKFVRYFSFIVTSHCGSHVDSISLVASPARPLTKPHKSDSGGQLFLLGLEVVDQSEQRGPAGQSEQPGLSWEGGH